MRDMKDGVKQRGQKKKKLPKGRAELKSAAWSGTLAFQRYLSTGSCTFFQQGHLAWK